MRQQPAHLPAAAAFLTLSAGSASGRGDKDGGEEEDSRGGSGGTTSTTTIVPFAVDTTKAPFGAKLKPEESTACSGTISKRAPFSTDQSDREGRGSRIASPKRGSPCVSVSTKRLSGVKTASRASAVASVQTCLASVRSGESDHSVGGF